MHDRKEYNEKDTKIKKDTLALIGIWKRKGSLK